MLREFYAAQDAKAIPYSMELTDAGGPLIGSGTGYFGSYNPYVPGAVAYGRVQTPVSQREARAHGETYAGSDPVDWLMDAVGHIAESASSSRFHFEDDSGKEFVVKRRPTDPTDVGEIDFMLKKLFEMPNPYQDWAEFISLMVIDFLLVGNAYWVKWKASGDRPTALYRMPPPFVRIVPDQFGPAKYLYKLPMMQDEIEFTPDKVMHLRRPNPHSPYYGVGLVKGGARVVDMEIALTNTSARYYENRAMPSGVVASERRVPRDVFNKLKAQLRSFYTGSQNSGSLMVLEAGLKWTSVSPSAQDALFAQMGGWSRDRILAMFNMNKKLLGIADDPTDSTTIADWQRLFDQKTMIPLLNKLAGAISRGLTRPGWGYDFKFDYEETQAPEQVIQRATLLSTLPGVKVHELRNAAGLPPSTGDKEVDDMVLNMPGPQLDANGQGGFADRNLPGEAGRPPLPENTRRIVKPSQAGGVASRIASNGKAMDIQSMVDTITAREHVLSQKAMAPANVTVGNRLNNEIPPEDTLHATRTAAIDGLVADMHRDIQDAVHSLERALLDTAEGKADGTMYQRVRNSQAWAVFRERLSAILQDGTERGFSYANIHHANAGFRPDTSMDYTKLAKAQVSREDGVKGIVATLKKKVLEPILNVQRHGSAPGEYTKTILSVLSDYRAHAETIALTEATIAYNTGTAQIAEHNRLNLLVSDGEDYDEPCTEANGQVWTPEMARARLIEHPRCRRGFVLTTAEAT
jgi:HK97 family phage portal protein